MAMTARMGIPLLIRSGIYHWRRSHRQSMPRRLERPIEFPSLTVRLREKRRSVNSGVFVPTFIPPQKTTRMMCRWT